MLDWAEFAPRPIPGAHERTKFAIPGQEVARVLRRLTNDAGRHDAQSRTVLLGNFQAVIQPNIQKNKLKILPVVKAINIQDLL